MSNAISHPDVSQLASPPARSIVGCTVFPAVTLGLAVFLVWPGGTGFPWSPGVSTVIAWSLIATHTLLVRKRASSMDPVVWIPVAMALFYCGMPIALELIGSTRIHDYDAWNLGLPFNLTRGFVAAVLTLSAFLSGLHLAGYADRRRPVTSVLEGRDVVYRASLVIALGGLLMMAVGVVLVGPNLVFGTYSDIWFAKKAGIDVRILETGFLFAQGATYGLLVGHDPSRPSRRMIALSASILLGLYSIATGDRSALISFGLAAAWIASQTMVRVPWWAAGALALIGVLVLPLLKEYREFREVRVTAEASPKELIATAFYEMGSTALAFGHTLDHIPKHKSYDLGMSYLNAVLSLVPNPGFRPGKGFLPAAEDHHPSSWLTWTLNPLRLKEGGGYGFAVGAEWYFNFGVPGIVLGMGAVGFLLAMLRNRARGSAFLMLASGLSYALLLLWTRNAFTAPLKVAVWPLVGIFVVSFFVGPARHRIRTESESRLQRA